MASKKKIHAICSNHAKWILEAGEYVNGCPNGGNIHKNDPCQIIENEQAMEDMRQFHAGRITRPEFNRRWANDD
jgi:hypothetical protein